MGSRRNTCLKIPPDPRPRSVPSAALDTHPSTTSSTQSQLHQALFLLRRAHCDLYRAPVKRRRIRPSIAATRHEHHTAIMSESLTTKQVAEHNTVEKGLYII